MSATHYRLARQLARTDAILDGLNERCRTLTYDQLRADGLDTLRADLAAVCDRCRAALAIRYGMRIEA